MTKYAHGYFSTEPTRYGAVPRWGMALARKNPDNGWAWYALAFGRFVCFFEHLQLICTHVQRERE